MFETVVPWSTWLPRPRENSKASVGPIDYFFFPRGSSSTSRMKVCDVRQRNRLIEGRCVVVMPLARDKAGSIIRKETIGLRHQRLFQAYQGCSVAVGARLIVMSEVPVSSSVVPRFLPKVTGSTSLEKAMRIQWRLLANHLTLCGLHG